MLHLHYVPRSIIIIDKFYLWSTKQTVAFLNFTCIRGEQWLCFHKNCTKTGEKTEMIDREKEK